MGELLNLRTTHDEESIANVIYEALDRKVYEAGRDYTTIEATVPTVIELDREVKNGGFSQFLRNYSSRFSDYVVGSLANIDCPKSEMAAKSVFEALPADWKSLERVELEDLLDPYDQLFFQTGENLYDALLSFVDKNRKNFSLPK